MCLENTGGVSWCSYLKDQESVTRSLPPALRSWVEWWRWSKFVPVAILHGWYPVCLQQNLTTNSPSTAGDNKSECPGAPGGTCPRFCFTSGRTGQIQTPAKHLAVLQKESEGQQSGLWHSELTQCVSSYSGAVSATPQSHQSGLEITQGEKIWCETKPNSLQN